MRYNVHLDLGPLPPHRWIHLCKAGSLEGGWTEKTKPSKMIMPNVEFFSHRNDPFTRPPYPPQTAANSSAPSPGTFCSFHGTTLAIPAVANKSCSHQWWPQIAVPVCLTLTSHAPADPVDSALPHAPCSSLPHPHCAVIPMLASYQAHLF